MDKIIIFGAGKKAIKQYDWAVFAGYRVQYFVDNDTEKWGKKIHGIPVCSPEMLKGNRCTIVMPDSHKKEMEIQLKRISYQGRKLGFEQFKKETLVRREIKIDLSDVKTGESTGEPTFVFDSYFPGLNWGGVESWSCTVANGLSGLEVKTCLLCGPNRRFDEFVDQCLHFSNENEVETVKEMAVKIAGFLPCIFITHGSIALYAALIVKSMFPEQIKIVAVAHGDERNTYKRWQFWSDQMDKIICISKKIQEEFQSRYRVKKDLLLCRPNPITVPVGAGKRENDNKVLKIGFAARLRKEQKRAHLLPEIIEVCLERKLDVEFDIVGEGECQELLMSYVTERHLEDKVHVQGWIPPTEMTYFWNQEDIYLNISDFEGMSLAMLEAMSCGALPVVTDVSGVRDLVEDGKNGFIVPVDNWMGIADKIEILDRDRDMLQRAGDYNRRLIREKCNVSDYAKWLTDTFHF